MGQNCAHDTFNMVSVESATHRIFIVNMHTTSTMIQYEYYSQELNANVNVNEIGNE